MPMYYFVVLSRVPLFNGIGWRVVIAAPTSFESSFWSWNWDLDGISNFLARHTNCKRIVVDRCPILWNPNDKQLLVLDS